MQFCAYFNDRAFPAGYLGNSKKKKIYIYDLLMHALLINSTDIYLFDMFQTLGRVVKILT